MFIQNYISKDYPVFQLGDSITQALDFTRGFGFSHIFITDNGFFIGAISKDCLDEYSTENLASLEAHIQRFGVLEEGNIIDSVPLFHSFEANIIPVIGKNENYLGYISYEDVFNEFSKYPLFSENGAILTIQAIGKYYSFTEIANIVENNNGKLYGIYISAINEGNFWITIKINSTSLSSIGKTFERYGYSIVYKHYTDNQEDLMKDRFGFFQKYLEI
ncbi:MAG: CBS domain-containing protein [Bergeyella zoohelcum]|nr:CBS domain-containing protein [Bergeyella zoohelcum]